jgi:hypothetical protein
VNVVPAPSTLSTRILPPTDSTMVLVIPDGHFRPGRPKMGRPPASPPIARDAVLLKVSLGARLERQRHPAERRVQHEMAGGGMRALVPAL